MKATLEERATLVELVSQIAERLAIPFTVGGGVRSAEDGEELLAAGADKVAVNSAALERPELVTELAGATRLAGGRRRDRCAKARALARGHDRDGPRRGRVGPRGARSVAPARSC